MVEKLIGIDRKAYVGRPAGYPHKSAVFNEVVNLYSKWKDIHGNDHWAYDSDLKTRSRKYNKPISTTEALSLVDKMLRDLVKAAEGK